MIQKRIIGFSLLLSLIFSGCSLHTSVNHVPLLEEGPRNLVVFLDGTNNDEKSGTNIFKLHNMVTLQDRRDIGTTYIKGVGTGAKVIGMAMGWGVRRDVIEAYQFLAENYTSQNDIVSIFGFSRGAYTARILAAFLYVAGIDKKIKGMKPGDRSDYIFDLYNAYKDENKTIAQRREAVAKVMGVEAETIKPINIRFMGIWDTVEALGWPDFKQDVGEPNTRYADQLCNIENISHAVSIDDDRARIFTPILLTQRHFIEETCDRSQTDPVVKEVWFSGAHSDVGGGYEDTQIGGISLNWMLGQMQMAGLNLLPQDTKVYGNYLDKTHDPEKGLFGLIYRKQTRNIQKITSSPDYVTHKGQLNPPLNIHQSVLDRICTKSPEPFESFWFRDDKYKNCVKCNNISGFIDSTQECSKVLKVEKDPNYEKHAITASDNYCDPKACWEAKGKAYSLTKSCNYNHGGIKERGTQRVQSIFLYSPESEKEIIFYANSKNDRTGIYLKRGLTYSIKIDDGDVENWVDCTQEADPYDGRNIMDSDGSKFFPLIAKPFAYSLSTGYMALLGEVAGEQFLLGQLAKNKKTFTPKKDGELILRVNEPRWLDEVYKNNHGMLRLTIKVEK